MIRDQYWREFELITCFHSKRGDLRRKSAIYLLMLLAGLLVTPIQAQALYGGTPPPNTISIDNGNSSTTASYISQTDSAYIMNRMSGFAGHSITRVWAYLLPMQKRQSKI